MNAIEMLKARKVIFMSWLVLVGSLSSEFNKELGSAFKPTFCIVGDIGFSDSAHGLIAGRPPFPDTVPYDNWCIDKSAIVQFDDTVCTVGRVDICEAQVYDGRYRGKIDFTGVRATIFLRDDAYRAYIDYVGKAKVPKLTDYISWRGGIVFRIPSSPFTFPMPRGSSHPWQSGGVVGELKPIKRFNFDFIEVQLLRDRNEQGRMIAYEGGSPADKTGLKPALRIGELSDTQR